MLLNDKSIFLHALFCKDMAVRQDINVERDMKPLFDRLIHPEHSESEMRTGKTLHAAPTAAGVLVLLMILVWCAAYAYATQLSASNTAHISGEGQFVRHGGDRTQSGGDTTWYVTYPYYEYIQYYDSTSVSCTIGEVRVHTGTGRTYLHPVDFDPEAHNPLCTVPLEDLNQRSIYQTAAATSGDTIRYFFDLNIHTVHGLDGVYLGIRDSIIFTTRLYDGDTGDYIGTLDTLAMFPASSPDSLHSQMYSSFWTDTSIVRTVILPAVGWSYNSIELKVGCEVRGSSDHDLLCRVDRFSPDRISEEMAEARMFVRMVVDSLLAEGGDENAVLASWKEGRVSPASPVIREIFPNPSPGFVQVSLQDNIPGQEIVFLVFDETGRKLFTSVPYRIFGNRRQLPLDLSHLSSGRYYLIPVLDMRIMPGSNFIIVTHDTN